MMTEENKMMTVVHAQIKIQINSQMHIPDALFLK